MQEIDHSESGDGDDQRHHASARRGRSLRGAALLAGLVIGVAGTLLVQRVGPGTAQARGRIERDTFLRVADTIVDRHVDPVDADAAYARALKSMVAGLDAHSHYLTRDERKALAKRARHGAGPGLALHFARVEDGEVRVEVAAVRPGSPAADQHIAAGDVVLAIRGRPVDHLSSPAEAEALMTGEEGDDVELLVQRKGAPRPARVSLELTRAHDARLVTARTRRTTSGERELVVGIVAIRGFEAGVGQQVRRALSELRDAHPGPLDGLVLDLRQNPGGRVDEALIVADLFVEEGVLTRTRGRGGIIKREERAHRPGTDTTTPLVVLQDRYSASAAELLAVALQEHGRAVVVGERSYGKGSVQEIIGLEDGSALTLTTARYFSPRDRRIDGVGVEPDVPLVIDDRRADALPAASGVARPVVDGDGAVERALAVFAGGSEGG